MRSKPPACRTVSPSPTSEATADATAREAAWGWLAALPRPVVAHGDRGSDPLAATNGLLAALGDPQHALRVIHIVGSKGKGSTALLIEALLQQLGQRTFTFTSPHLERWTERLRVDGREVAGRQAGAAIDAVRQAAASTGIQPGFFEALAVAGLWLAREAGVDWCIIEAGVGGRADATNVVSPALVILTSIEREHTERLGNTLAAIAREKAGAIKPGVPLVVPALAAEVEPVIRDAARAAGAPVTRLAAGPAAATDDREVDTIWSHRDRWLRVDGPGGQVRVPMTHPGHAVALNTAIAVTAVQRLGLASREDVQRAARVWQQTILPGRFETLSTLPWLVVDGAHTGASALALAATVRDLAPRRVTLLLSLSASKELAGVTDPLLALASTVVVTCADRDYSLPAPDLAAAILQRWPELDIAVEEDPTRALARACRQPDSDHLVLATGSMYLAGRIRSLATA